MSQAVIKIHPRDNVLVALKDFVRGTEVEYEKETYTLQDNISAKHKFFINDMCKGDEIIMYGVLVGKVQNDVIRGGIMTTANTKHAAEPYFYRDNNFKWLAPDVSRFIDKTFNGYHRSDGRVGTANYWFFIPTVFCENRNMDVIRDALHNKLGYGTNEKYKSYTKTLLQSYSNGENIDHLNLSPASQSSLQRPFRNVDGIKFLNHQGGCGGIRKDAEILSKLIAAYADHPNSCIS